METGTIVNLNAVQAMRNSTLFILKTVRFSQYFVVTDNTNDENLQATRTIKS
jgi:hypothetical protein